MSRNLEISFQRSAQAIKNTTLCKLHKVPKGLRTMGSNADQVPRHNPKGLCESQLGPGSSVLVSEVANCQLVKEHTLNLPSPVTPRTDKR